MFGDLGKMLKMASEVKTKLPAMQAKLAAATYTAQAGGGAAKATVNGKGSLVELWIDPALLSDPEMTAESLAAIIKAAVTAAQAQALEEAQKAIHELTGGMELPGLSGMTGL